MAIYKIYKNGSLIFDGSQKVEPKLHLEVNGGDSLSFKDTIVDYVPSPTDFKNDTYMVKEEDKIIFSGRPSEINLLYDTRFEYYVEGAFSYFNDTLVDMMDTPLIADALTMFVYIINSHNRLAASNRKIKVGTVTVDKVVVRQYNYEKCIDELRSLRDECGGFMVFTYTNDGQPILNWYDELPRNSTQVVEFGTNMIDFNKNLNPSEIITHVLPLGPVIEQTDDEAKVDDLHILNTDVEHLHLVGQNLTLTNRTVVHDSNYLTNGLADTVGAHYQKVDFSSVKSAQELLTYGQRYLANLITQMIYYTVDMCDLHYAKGYSSVKPIEFATNVIVFYTPYSILETIPCSEMDINLDSALKSITLGTIKQQPLSEKLLNDVSKSSNTSSDLQKQVNDLKQRSFGSGGGGGGDENNVDIYKLMAGTQFTMGVTSSPRVQISADTTIESQGIQFTTFTDNNFSVPCSTLKDVYVYVPKGQTEGYVTVYLPSKTISKATIKMQQGFLYRLSASQVGFDTSESDYSIPSNTEVAVLAMARIAMNNGSPYLYITYKDVTYINTTYTKTSCNGVYLSAPLQKVQ